MTITKIADHIIANKLFYSGIAILMIVLTHVELVDNNIFWLMFYPGYLGVDIFMFYSGYGLCYSFEKNPLRLFYKRRVKRVLPSFFLMVIIVCLLKNADGSGLTGWDWFCNLTTLNYYRIGGFYIEWYLCTLVLFYASFPLLFLICKHFIIGGGKRYIYDIVLLVCVVISTYCDDQYICAIGRIPIFSLGILLYLDKSLLKRWLCSFCILLIITIPLFLKGFIPTFYLFYMAAPIIVGIIAMMGSTIICNKQIKLITEWIGKHTLEIYVTNIIVCFAMIHFPFLAGGSLYYFFGFFLITPLILFCNKFITKIL